MSCETLGIRLSDDLDPDVEAGVDGAVRLVEGDPEVVHAVTHELLDHLGQGGHRDRPLDMVQSVEFINFTIDTYGMPPNLLFVVSV